MDIAQLTKKLVRTVSSPNVRAERLLTNYGHILSYEQITSLLLRNKDVWHLPNVIAAYIKPDLLLQLPPQAIAMSHALSMRLSRKQTKQLELHKTTLSWELHLSPQKLYRRRLIDTFDGYMLLVRARHAYDGLIHARIRDNELVDVITDAAPYLTTRRLRRLIRCLWKRHVQQLGRWRERKAAVIEMGESCRTDALVRLWHKGVLSGLPPRDAVRLTNIILTSPGENDIVRCCPAMSRIIDVPLLHWKVLRFMLQRIVAYSPQLDARLHFARAQRLLLTTQVRRILRHGHLVARLASRDRMHIGLAFPRLISPRLFTESEIQRLKALIAIGEIGDVS